uniref:Uncharacterized protein n=1 Tax=Helianthus annuus TaxID=4232 RepID=A0A251TRK6_HELAN
MCMCVLICSFSAYTHAYIYIYKHLYNSKSLCTKYVMKKPCLKLEKPKKWILVSESGRKFPTIYRRNI